MSTQKAWITWLRKMKFSSPGDKRSFPTKSRKRFFPQWNYSLWKRNVSLIEKKIILPLFIFWEKSWCPCSYPLCWKAKSSLNWIKSPPLELGTDNTFIKYLSCHVSQEIFCEVLASMNRFKKLEFQTGMLDSGIFEFIRLSQDKGSLVGLFWLSFEQSFLRPTQFP